MRTAECIKDGCAVMKWHTLSDHLEGGCCLRCENAVLRQRLNVQVIDMDEAVRLLVRKV